MIGDDPLDRWYAELEKLKVASIEYDKGYPKLTYRVWRGRKRLRNKKIRRLMTKTIQHNLSLSNPNWDIMYYNDVIARYKLRNYKK